MRTPLFALAACVALAPGQDIADAPDGATLPLIVEVPSPPVAARAGGGFKVVYELHLTNWSGQAMTLTSILITPRRDSLDGFTLRGEELEASMSSLNPLNKHRRLIAPGERAVVFLFLTASGLPKEFFHRIRFHGKGREEELLTAAMPVQSSELVLRPPLRGGPWLAANGPDGNTHHRRSSMSYGGRVVVPQRFTIDFVRLNDKGETHSGNPRENRNYLCYGNEALAVADATVVRLKDGIPENIPHPTERAVPMSWETVSGNYVVLDLGSGRFAVYAHLQPGSLRVKVGDRVKTGDALGLVGNSGMSTEPHLHFHVSDSLDLGGDGLPFAFDRFYREGRQHNEQIPLRDWRIDFP
ncbi:MAG: M23 family metallopeptidase [Acidobacteria bacterium]|nr:M23 family metallopeptidase [Acidobacteriota bacterium]